MMPEILRSIWVLQVRIAPIVLALLIFGLLHLARRLTRVAYTPSYFALFPLSMLDYQLSIYFGEFYGGEYVSKKKGRTRNRNLFVKALLSFFLTFFFIPLLFGVIISSFLLSEEFRALLVLLLLWEGSGCLRAIMDFSSYRREKRKLWLFFGTFYAAYLGALFLIIRFGYNYARPFTANGDWSGLFHSLESSIVPFLINIIVISVVGGVLTHWFLNKDAVAPTEIDELPHDDTD